MRVGLPGEVPILKIRRSLLENSGDSVWLSGIRKLRFRADSEREVGQCSGNALRPGWLQSDVVVHRVAEPLFAAKVSLSGLDTHVAEKELDLFKLPTRFVA